MSQRASGLTMSSLAYLARGSELLLRINYFKVLRRCSDILCTARMHYKKTLHHWVERPWRIGQETYTVFFFFLNMENSDPLSDTWSYFLPCKVFSATFNIKRINMFMTAPFISFHLQHVETLQVRHHGQATTLSETFRTTPWSYY